MNSRRHFGEYVSGSEMFIPLHAFGSDRSGDVGPPNSDGLLEYEAQQTNILDSKNKKQ